MTNKRDLKKYVRRTCGGVAGECVLAMAIVPGIDREKMGQALVEIADLQSGSLALLSFDFDRAVRDFSSAKEYHKARRNYYHAAYAKFLEDFEARLGEIVKTMNEALPAEQREQFKKK